MALDPTKHVNYVEGMVLGAADLRQEFAYLSHRDQWIVRDLLGYGSIWGLQVTSRLGARGPEIVVASGVAVNPRGQLIRVAPAQCAPLNDWLAGRTAEVDQRKQSTGSPPSGFSLPLHVVLRYRPCDADPVPIAGEPCRTEQDSLAPSRTADDFQLELAFDPPPQIEEDAQREFVQWLRAHITVTAGGTASLGIPQFLDGIRAAANAGAAAVTSPPGAGPRLVDSSPPAMVSVPAAFLPDYLRAALRLWVTELRARPGWRPDWLGDKHGCTGDGLFASADEGNRLLLAAISVPIVPPGLGSPAWVVAASPAIAITDAARPYLLPQRFLQEWLIAQVMGLGAGAGAGPAGPRIVAAGVLRASTTTTGRPVVGNLRVLQVLPATTTATQLLISFDGYSQPPAAAGPQYLVKALLWPGGSPAPSNLSVMFGGFQATGFVLAVGKGTPPNGAVPGGGELDALQLMVEVSQYP
jgi:hypothetical protein